MCKDFTSIMTSEFEISMMGGLNFFLGLQVKQMKKGTFIFQEKYTNELVRKCGMENSKSLDIPMSLSQSLTRMTKASLLIPNFIKV